MGYRVETPKPGKFRSHEPVNGWPTVIIRTYRRTQEGLVEDTLQLQTDHPPAMGEHVQGYDFEYYKVVKIEKSYQEQSPPVIYVTCEKPRDGSLNC